LAALVAGVALVASVARAVLGGQDLNFDLITYHYYVGYGAFHDRLGLDFLPAGPLSYQSPLPYSLLYFVDRAGVPPVANAALHAALHAVSLAVLFPLTRVLLRGTAIQDDRAAWLAFWLLGAVTPVYWQLVGTSFADGLTSALLLCAVWLVAEALPAFERRGSLAALAIGALLAGAVVGMRVHGAIFVVAMGAALLVVPLPRGAGRVRLLAVFATAAAAGWLLCFAPLAWRLYREFSSPLFPLFNAWFGSPDFPGANLSLVGFAPSSVGEALALPFRMAVYGEWVHGEKPYPDVRPALLVLSAAGCLLFWAYRQALSRTGGAPASAPARSFLLLFFLAAGLLWLVTSANSRYGLPLLLLAGPVCGALLQRILPMRHVLLVVGLAVLWQGLQHQVFFKQYRWPSAPWTARYFDWEVPPAHLREPATYLSFGAKTASSLAPRLHPASRHANLVGPYSTGLDHPSARRIRELIDGAGRLYGIFDYYYTQQSDPAARSIKDYFGGHLRLWNLDFSSEPCTLIRLGPADAAWQRFNRALGVSLRASPPEFIVCELRAALPQDHAAAMQKLRRFEGQLASLAKACPRVLGGPVSPVRVHGGWHVSSFASQEFRLEFDDAGPVHLQLLRPPFTTRALATLTGEGVVLEAPCDASISGP
jgi:hypothetical protein